MIYGLTKYLKIDNDHNIDQIYPNLKFPVFKQAYQDRLNNAFIKINSITRIKLV